jgi:hypothetical protein
VPIKRCRVVYVAKTGGFSADRHGHRPDTDTDKETGMDKDTDRARTRTWTWTISSSTSKLVLLSLYHLTKCATESLVLDKWCYQFAAPISKIVRGTIYL